MTHLIVSIVFSTIFSISTYAQSGDRPARQLEVTADLVFDTQDYLKKCGGKIYPQCDTDELNQLTVYKHAEAVAKATNRSIFLIVGADWCPPCKMVDAALKSNPKIKAEIEKKFVIVSLSGDSNATKSSSTLLDYLKISLRGFPTFITVDPITNKASVFVTASYEINDLKQALLLDGDPQNTLEDIVAGITELSKVPVNKLDTPLDLNEKFGQYSYIKSGFLGRETQTDKAINAGIARLHNFHYIDAVRAFRMAVKDEPDNDLARSFLALAYIKFDLRSGSKFANLELSKVRPDRMKSKDLAWYQFIKSYIFKTAQNLIGDTDVLDISDALANLNEKRPNDLEVLTLAQYLAKGAADPAPFLQALIINPNHLGANHYLTHHYEESLGYPFALDHAKVMASIATDSSHAQHMLGHVLPRFQEWQQAKDQFDLAASTHKSWSKKYNFKQNYDWHYSHNLDLMAITYVSFGKINEAVEMLKFSCKNDARGCESLLKLSAAEGRVNDISWVKNHYISAGAESTRVDEYLQIYKIQAELKLVLDAQSVYTDSYKQEVLRSASDFVAFSNDKNLDAQAGVIKYMLYVYILNYTASKDQEPQVAEYESKVIESIYSYSEDRVGCSSFDGWGKGLLDTYRFYRLAQSLGQDNLSEKLKSILVTTLGISYKL